jgi:Phage protein (N4 Gp49/phage Sf6 gene 66) family
MPTKETEASIEAALQTKGLNAPRLTPQMIDDQILSEQYYVFPGTTMTVCALTLCNGFVVIGESAAASPKNFDEEIGRRIARDDARNKIWALEGYTLRNVLSGRMVPEEDLPWPKSNLPPRL